MTDIDTKGPPHSPSSEAEGGRTITFPDLPPALTGGWSSLLRVFGPGAIIASVTVGTGETIFSPRLGAIFGYAMLWVIVTAVVSPNGQLRST